VERTPERWFEPTQPVAAPEPRRRGSVLLPVVAAAVLAAVLASGGTILALQGAGVLDRAAAPGATTDPVGQPVDQRTVQIDEQSAITRAAETVSPAVVMIEVAGAQGNPFVVPETGVGSGIVYDSRGWILTNRHVVCNAEEMTVTLNDGRELPGRVYGIDTLTDLAIVKIDAQDLPVAPVGSSSALKPGQLAVAIGSPLGVFTNSVTSGVVSALGRQIEVQDDACGSGRARQLRNLIQTDAAINPGNSGGALVDSAGQVIGVNTAIAGNAEGIGFAIPIDIARPIMQQAVDGQELQRPYLGVYYQDIAAQLAADEELPVDYGAWLHRADGGDAIQEGGPADQAGLQDGDIITAIEGQRIDGQHPVDLVLAAHEPGDTVTLDVLRDGQPMTVELTLGERPAE
jgi:S1-C subfamily serine protease